MKAGRVVQLIELWSTLTLAVTYAKLIDLSHDHDPNTVMSPHQPHFNRSTNFAGDYVPGVYVESGVYASAEHGGTHLDAPVHFNKGGQRLHEIPLENTVAEGVMINCAEEAANSISYSVPVEKILDWEKKHGEIPQSAAVIFNFGYSYRFNDLKLYVNSESADKFTYVFPTVSAEAGMWLYDNRNIKIIATDTMTPDPFTLEGNPGTQFPIHQRYLKNNRLIVENLRGPERLPPRGFRFFAVPVKYVGNTGSQIRAFAMTHDEDLGRSSASRCDYAYAVFFVLSLLLYLTM